MKFRRHTPADTIYSKIKPDLAYDYDTLKEKYSNSDAIALEKIYAIKSLLGYKERYGLDTLPPLTFYKYITTFADIPADFSIVDLDAEAYDILYGTLQYIRIADTLPNDDCKELLGAILAREIVAVPFKPLQFLNYYIHKNLAEGVRYRVEHNRLLPAEEERQRRVFSILYSIIRRKKGWKAS